MVTLWSLCAASVLHEIGNPSLQEILDGSVRYVPVEASIDGGFDILNEERYHAIIPQFSLPRMTPSLHDSMITSAPSHHQYLIRSGGYYLSPQKKYGVEFQRPELELHFVSEVNPSPQHASA